MSLAAEPSETITTFDSATPFWRQLIVAQSIISNQNKAVIPLLAAHLSDENRHTRCNAAFAMAGLGDPRGFDAIVQVLSDKTDRPKGDGITAGGWNLRKQIQADRYYAVHLLALLKDTKATSVLAPLLTDKEVNYKVAWALGESGDTNAIPPLISTLNDDDPDVRVLTINALIALHAESALPAIRALLKDTRRTHTGSQPTVAETAQKATVQLESKPQPPAGGDGKPAPQP